MASGQEDAASGLALANDMAGGRGGQNAILADDELLDTVGNANLGDQLDDFGIPVPAITANDEEGAYRKK